jgi:hypothetical protein
MGGSLLQLVATGSEDIYISGKPVITMFKTVYRRHLDFSIYDIIKIPKTKNTLGVDFQVELDRSGDLLHKVYLMITLPELKLQNPIPTCDNVKKILKDYGIIWDTSEIKDYNIIIDNCPSRVTLEIYNNTIIEVINDHIQQNTDKYNFYSNANIFSSNSDYLKSTSEEVINRALKSTFDYVFRLNKDFINYAVWGDIIKNQSLEIKKNQLLNGIVGSLMLSSKMMTKYSQEYLSFYSSEYLPNLINNDYQVAVDAFGTKKRDIVLYSDNFRNGYDSNISNILFNTGSLLHMLLNYYYDTTIMNLNPKTSPYSHGYLKLSEKTYFNSNSLFGELLNRPPNTLENEGVKFQLYNSTDIKNIYYISLMYNLTRLKFENLQGPYDFKLDHYSIYVGDISPPLNDPDLIGVYNPYVILIDENIIFYHVLDPKITSYKLNQSQIGKNISIYFNEIIQDRYKIFNTYNEIFPFYNGRNFNVIDSFNIYQKYINDFFIDGDFENIVVRDENQVEEIASAVLYYINYNVQYNLALIRNMINVLNNSKWTSENHYRFSYYKGYTKINDSSYSQKLSLANNLDNTTFNNNSDNNTETINDNLSDNFETVIRNNMIIKGELNDKNIPTQTPGGADIKNYFSLTINEKIQKFRDNSGEKIAVFEKLGYMDNYLLWERGIFDIGKQIQKTYSSYSNKNIDPQFKVNNSFSEQYKRHAIMNYIPFLAARDIPAFIYYMFSTSIRVKTILNLFGNFNEFINSIDYRDDGDNGAPLLDSNKKEIKNYIYGIMIDSVMGVDLNLHDSDHYDELIKQYSNGNDDFLLTNTFRPEVLKAQYDKITNLQECLSNVNVSCVFESQNIDDITYLPIEWLTQTYCELYDQIIDNFFNQPNKTLDEKNPEITVLNSKINTSNINDNILFTEDEGSNGRINLINEFKLILRSILNCFISYTEDTFPNYTNIDPSLKTYVNNGYTLIGLVPETTLANSKYFIRDSVDIFKSIQYSDATSSIWYQLQKKYIIQYNELFNNTLISKSYYQDELGILMSNIFDNFKNTINGDKSFIYYYDKQDLKNEEAVLLGSVKNDENFDNNQIKTITIVINGSVFGNINNNFEERVLLTFKTSDQTNKISVLKNHLIGFDLRETVEYNETFDIPENINSIDISYINNPGYQIYLNITVYLNEDIKYYEFNVNNYEDKFLKSWYTINNINQNILPDILTKEPYPPININSDGFDFYRLRNLDVINKYSGKTKYTELQNFINDNITLFNYNLKYYEDYSLILDFINDDDLIYNDGNIDIVRKIENYIYEQSYKICNYLNEHITLKYLNQLPLANNYNEITTKDETIITNNLSQYRQISDIKPVFSQEKLPLFNTDIIGFAFQLSGNLQNDYAVGFGVGTYPYSQKKIQIKKIGNSYFIIISTKDSETNNYKSKIDINMDENKMYYFLVNINIKEVKIYEMEISTQNIITMHTISCKELYDCSTVVIKGIYESDHSFSEFIKDDDCNINMNELLCEKNDPNLLFESIISGAVKNFYFYVDGLVTVKFFDLFESYNFAGNIINIDINNVSKWFYAGINNNTNDISFLIKYSSNISHIQQFLHTVYFENNISVNLNQLTNIITTSDDSKHPFGQTIQSPPIIATDDKFGFAFTILNNIPDFDVGILGSNNTDKYGKISIKKENSIVKIYLEYDTNNYYEKNIWMDDNNTIPPDFETNKIYYVFYNNNILADPKFVLYEYNVDNYTNKKWEISNAEMQNVNGIDMRNLFYYNFNFILNGATYIRYYMDRFAYFPYDNLMLSDSDINNIKINLSDIRNLISNLTKWYYIGGTYSIPYTPDLEKITSVQFKSQINNFNLLENNTIKPINIGQFNFNDIVFPFGDNLLTFATNIPTPNENTDMIGYAFSILDNTADTVGIGLGTDGYFSEKRLIMERNGIEHKIKIYDGINTEKSYNYTNQPPIFDTSNIYYCFQDNNNGSFTIYEDKNIDELTVINNSVEYLNLLKIFKNNANLFIEGSTNVRFYSAKYAYLQASDKVKQLIQNTNKWLYIGAEDIDPFVSNINDITLENVTHRLHTGYLENNIVKKLDDKPYYVSQLNKINSTINPLNFNNIYNLNGINGSITNINGNKKELGYNTAIYGILDSLYNNRLTGNMDSTFKSLNVNLPEGKIYSDTIDNNDNPFYSYCLYDYFVNMSSKVNYDGYQIKSSKNELKNSELLTYGNLLDMSNMFSDVIYNKKNTETEHVLENIKYIKEPSYIKTNLIRINDTNQSEISIITNDDNEHIFSSNSTSIDGFAIPNINSYGFGFTISNTNDNAIIEIGVIFNKDLNQKIILRKNNLRYDLLIQNGNFKKIETLNIVPNFNVNNIFTFFISNKDHSNLNLNINKATVIIYENENKILDKSFLNEERFLNLFSGKKVHLYTKGRAIINYHSRSFSLQISNTTVGNLISEMNLWLYINQNISSNITQKQYISYTLYQQTNANRFYEDDCTISFTKNTDTSEIIDNHFIPTINMQNNDSIGFAFEILPLTLITNDFSIGFGSGNIPELDRLQIKKKGDKYMLNINDTNTIINNKVSFTEGNIYLCIQNNKMGTFTVYRYSDNNIYNIIEISIENNRSYEKILYSILNTQLNMLVSCNDNLDVKMYTAKYMFNISSLNNKILIGNLTKWIYLGALDIKPIIKTVIDPETLSHHQLIDGLTLGGEIYETISTSNDESSDLVTPPILNIPVQYNPPTDEQPSYIYESSLIKLKSPNYNDIILNDIEPRIKPIGIGIKQNTNTIKKIFSFAFSIIEIYSDFSVGFMSWFNTYIVINRKIEDGKVKYRILIKYLEFIENVDNSYVNEIIDIPVLSNNPCAIFYVFQNNYDNTFSLYEENKLIYQLYMKNSTGYMSLLNQTVPPIYKTLNTSCTLCIEGTNQTTIRFYSESYVKNISQISVRNILNLDDIVWFGVSTIENTNINNTADYRILSSNNSSIYMNPPVLINTISILANGDEQINKKGTLGFSFSLIDLKLDDYNLNGVRIGLAAEKNINSGINNISENNNLSLIEMQIFNDRISIIVNKNEKNYYKLPSLTSTDIYYIFQNNDTSEFKIYENDALIFKIDVTDNDYKIIREKFNDPIYLLIAGKTHIKMHNAPYAYINSISEIKIQIDLCTKWLYLGGTNLGPIKKRKITSANLYKDKNIPKLFTDPIKGNLSNFSLISLYTYFELLKNSQINQYIDLKPFIDNVSIIDDVNNDKGYMNTIEKINIYVKAQIDIYFKKILKITNINLEENELIINKYNVFLNNSYKQYPLDFNFDIFFYQESPSGRPNGIIYSDLESRLLKLIMNAPPRYSWVKELGHKIIKEVSVSIGDQVVETYTSDLTHLHHKFRIPTEHKRGYDKMIGNDIEMYEYSSDKRSIKKLYIPLYFWFCENEGNSLPMISLLHSRVMLNFKIESLENLFYLENDSYISGPQKVEYSILSQYIYLDEQERMRMAQKKLEYLVERYLYNGEDIISKNTYFSQELVRPVQSEFNEIKDISYDDPVIYALKNLVYHKHESVSFDSTIENERIGKKNFKEVITRSHYNHNFLPAFNLSNNKIIGFCFEIISKPETLINYKNETISNNKNLKTFEYGIGIQIEIYKIVNNKKIVNSIRQIELREKEILITNKYNLKGSIDIINTINYITLPKFEGGGIDNIADNYLYIHDDLQQKAYIYENSDLIGIIDLIAINEFIPIEGYKRNMSLFIYGATRIFFYNAKKPYNTLSNLIKEKLETITDWLYVGGDNLPITEITNYQNTTPYNIPDGSLQLQTNGKSILKIYTGEKYILLPSINVNNNSLIGFSFNINYESLNSNYDIIIGIGTEINNNMVVGLRKIKNNYDIYVNDGINSSSVSLLKKPIQNNLNHIQNPLFRPEIIYTCIQDNITKTFTIYQENTIIGQIDTSNEIYNNLYNVIQNNVSLYINNIKSSSSLLISYYTSEEMINNHARLILRRIINNITDWLSLNNFNPSFYKPSFRNLSISLINNVSNKGRIVNQTKISSDVITDKDAEQYILRPTNFTDITRMIGFSFNILEPVTSDFEIGFSVINNAYKHIVVKKSGNSFYLEISNIARLPLNFQENILPASLSNKRVINEILKYNNQKIASCVQSETKIKQLNKQILEFEEIFNMNQQEYAKLNDKLDNSRQLLLILEESSSKDITNEILRKQINDIKTEIQNIENSSIFILENQINLLKKNRTSEKNKKRTLQTSIIEILTYQIPLSQNLSYGEGVIYTIVQDNTLGIFSLFLNELIIGQATLAIKAYRDILPDLINGMDIYVCGMMNLRFYSPQYIYQSSTQKMKNYLDRIDHFYFVRSEIQVKKQELLPFNPTPVSIKITLTDPIKYFIWYMKAYDETTQQPIDILDWSKYGLNIRDKCGDLFNLDPIVKSMKFQMYGVDREREREEIYFTSVIPWARNIHTQSLNSGEYMYSFALYPLLLQPSGAANYSEIEDSRLIIEFTNEVELLLRENKNIKIKFEMWGRAVNHLRIISGMGGLLFYKEQ